jgi:hypothetical protein
MCEIRVGVDGRRNGCIFEDISFAGRCSGSVPADGGEEARLTK